MSTPIFEAADYLAGKVPPLVGEEWTCEVCGAVHETIPLLKIVVRTRAESEAVAARCRGQGLVDAP